MPSVTGKVSMAWPLSCDGSSASLHQRRRLKLNCGKLPHTTEARSDLAGLSLKHRETRHLAADAFTGCAENWGPGPHGNVWAGRQRYGYRI